MAMQLRRLVGTAGPSRRCVSAARLRTSARARLQVVCASKAKFFVGGNWKANGTQSSVTTLVQDLNAGAGSFDTRNVDVVVAPTLVHLAQVKKSIDLKYAVSSQNVWLRGTGAFTGETPAEILADLGITWAITGHSERRALCGETNEVVGIKTQRALEVGLSVIPCIGETLEQRNAGDLFGVLEEQVSALTDHVKDWSRVVVAYEPVWAIGTGVVATPAQAQEVHAYLRKLFSSKLGAETASTLRIIYGGSVTDQNCAELAGQPDIDGFLVGGASLKASAFLKIISAHQVKAAIKLP